MTDLKEVYTELQNNPTFKEAFQKNPEEALKAAGFNLNADDLAKIKARLNLDKSKNEKLDDRISK